MRIYIILIAILMSFVSFHCNNNYKNKIYGQWLVIEYSYNDQLIIPDTTGRIIYLPQMSFRRNGIFSIPTTWSNKKAQVGRYRIKKKKEDYYIIIHESVDSNFLGKFSVNIFIEEDVWFHGNTNTYMELLDTNFYLLLKKNLDL